MVGPMDADAVKKAVGYRAVDDYITSGMLVGLGTGSTAAHVVDRVGQKLKSGELKDIRCIPTSEETRKRAEGWGIPLITLDDATGIDVAIDGADEVDGKLNLVKGRGGALLREKLIEENAKRFVVVVGNDKIMERGLGPSGQFPIEVNKFCSKYIVDKIKKLPSLPPIKKAEMRKTKGGELFESDNQNYIVDLFFDDVIKDPYQSADEIIKLVGVVEHGMFLDMATECVIGYPDGKIEVKTRS